MNKFNFYYKSILKEYIFLYNSEGVAASIYVTTEVNIKKTLLSDRYFSNTLIISLRLFLNQQKAKQIFYVKKSSLKTRFENFRIFVFQKFPYIQHRSSNLNN